MKVIDAHTGTQFDVPLGGPTLFPLLEAPKFRSVEGGTLTVLAVEPGIFKARALLQQSGQEPRWSPLTVRWTHPGFPFKHVAFINT